jgi:colicin import membrane protein
MPGDMSNADTIRSDGIWRVLEERQQPELRFRSAVITSTALHTGITLALLLAPLFIPKPQLFEFTPVNLVQLQAPEPAPTPPPPAAEEQDEAPEPEPEPEPAELEPAPPEDVPADLEAQRIQEEEEAARRREEERRKREEQEEAERRRLAEEARRRREAEEEARRRAEEEARRQPQQASRRESTAQPEEITQQADRGQVGMQLEPGMTEQDLNYLSFWINRVLTNISNNWSQQTRPPGSQIIEAVIHFRVDRNGRIIEGPEVRSTSRDRRYDDAAVRAVLGGQPFPPLPQAYRGSTLAINLAFRQE